MSRHASLSADANAADSILTFVVPAPNGCDLACPFCFIRQRQEAAASVKLCPTDYVNFILSAVKCKAVGAICVQGYEPLLPDAIAYTEEILAVGQRLSIPTGLVTNGTHLRQSVPLLARLKPARIAVSLDSAEAAVHDRQRGKAGAFGAAIQGLKFAVSVPTLKKVLVVTSVLMPKKRDQLLGMPKLLSDIGVDRWVINALIKVGKGNKLGGPVGECQSTLEDLLVLKAEADLHDIDMVVDDEFGRLSDDDYARELMNTKALRIKRLVKPDGCYRLVPTGQCSRGADILKPVHSKTPVWSPATDAGEFLIAMD